MINTVDHDSNSDSNSLLTTDLEDCNVIRKDEVTKRDKGQHRVSEKDQEAWLVLTILGEWIKIEHSICQLDKCQHLGNF